MRAFFFFSAEISVRAFSRSRRPYARASTLFQHQIKNPLVSQRVFIQPSPHPTLILPFEPEIKVQFWSGCIAFS